MKTEVDALWIARVIAESDDSVQAEFFNELGRVFNLVCKGKSNMQFAYFTDKLDGYGERFFEEVIGYIKIKQEEERINKKRTQ